MLGKTLHAIEKTLRARGFTSPDARRIMSGHMVLTGMLLAVGLLLYPWTAWGVSLALGSLVATVNLWSLARSVVRTMNNAASGVQGLVHFAGFLGRFVGTGAVLWLALTKTDLPPFPLVAGLFSVIPWLTVFGVIRIAGHSKEA